MTDLYRHHHARLLELLKKLAHQKKEVTLSSGRKSNFYIDCKQVVLGAEGHYLTAWLLLRKIGEAAPEAKAVGGLTMGADPLVSGVSLLSYLATKPLAGFYVRKEPKAHGTGEWIEGGGALSDGMPTVILEDVVTTGASTIRAIERARGAGLDIKCAIALVDRQEGGREAIEAHAPVHSLFTKADFQ